MGLLNGVAAERRAAGEQRPLRSRACSGSLLAAVESPAGAASPLLVTAVAVVRFFVTVLSTMLTNAASSRAMPPPSWAETLLAMVLLVIEMVPGVDRETCEPLVCRSRMPPPSSLARFAWMTLPSMVTGPVPGESWSGSAGSSPATITAPPSS